MNSTTVAAHATATRPNRILVVLATAWMVLSLAIGGVFAAEPGESASSDTVTRVTVTQP